ncbi:hypothetical protein LEMLEM_LOCUS13983, partial [Lemmus lemmus]
ELRPRACWALNSCITKTSWDLDGYSCSLNPTCSNKPGRPQMADGGYWTLRLRICLEAAQQPFSSFPQTVREHWKLPPKSEASVWDAAPGNILKKCWEGLEETAAFCLGPLGPESSVCQISCHRLPGGWVSPPHQDLNHYGHTFLPHCYRPF